MRNKFSVQISALAAITLLFSITGAYGATGSIYGDHAPEEKLPETAQQAIVGTLTILLFVLMALELTSPEVLFLIALIIVILCEILTIKEGLAGMILYFDIFYQ